MNLPNRSGQVNWKVVAVLAVVVAVLAATSVVGHYARKRTAATRAVIDGQAAYVRQDWPTAARNFWQYLQKYPDDPEVLAKYAHAQSQVRPLDGGAIQAIIASYRRLVRFQPDNQEAYDQLARLYAGIRDYDNLAYIARMRLTRQPNDLKASVWLGRALAAQHKPEQVREVLQPIIDKWSNVPQRYPEYIDACSLLSEIAAQSNASQAYLDAQQWLDRGVQYDPQAPEALINRARFRRTLATVPRQSRQALLTAARQDLEQADSLRPADPRQRLILSDEWMRLGQLDRAAAELDAVRDVKPQVIEEYFFDPTDWRIALYLQAAELTLREGNIAAGTRQTDQILADLNDKGQRLPALPTAVRVYIAADRLSDAERCLKEYQDNKHLNISTLQSEETAGLLEALLARAQARPYRVIELLEPITSRNLTNPAAWRLLAEAYTQTDQVRRSIRAIRQYLTAQPDDVEMARMLMRNYVRQQDWSRAISAARTLESLDSQDLEAQLLQIEDAINRAIAESPGQRQQRLAPLDARLDVLAREHPQLIDVWTLRAAVAANVGDTDRAERELQHAQSLGLDPLSLQLHRAHLYLSLRQADKAIATLQQACQPTTTQLQPWLELSDLQRTRGQIQQARQTLQAALDAVSSPSDKRDVQMKLAVLDILDGNHQAGIQILRSLAAQDLRNIRVRTLLLSVSEVQQNPAETAQLIDEIRRIEGERGLTWRLWQASIWLAGPDWRSHQKEIDSALQRCIDADPGWTAPALMLGRIQEQIGNFDRAEAVYRNVLAADPGALEVADRLLTLLQRQGRLSQATDVLKNLDATDTALSSRRTLVAMETGHLDQAIDELKVRTSHDPQDVQSRVLLAQLVYRQNRDAAQALRYLDEADATAPGSIAVTMGRVIILNAEGRQQAAVEHLDALVNAKDSFEAHQLRGSYLANIGQPEQAEKDYVRLTKLPGDGTGHQVLGVFYAQTQRLDQAIRTWRTGLETYPANLALQRNLMKGLMQRNTKEDSAEALRFLAALETSLPNDPELLTIRASLLTTQRTEASAARAEKMLEQAIQIAPTCVDAHLGLITIALDRHDYDTARKRSVFALGINPNDTRLLALRAQTELALGNHIMARDLASLILKDNPHDAQARSLLVQAAVASRNERDLQTAHSLVNDELTRNPADLQLQLTHALVVSSLGQTDEAIDTLQQYIATDAGHTSVEAAVALADLYQSKGDFSKADELLTRAAQLQPTGPAAVRGRINWLAVQKRYDAIVELANQYQAAPDVDPDVMVAAASALATAGDKSHGEQALKLFEVTLQAAPALLAAQAGYASLAYQIGHIDAAEAMYRRILQVSPNNVQALNDLAWLLCKDRNQSEQALDLVDRAVHLAHNNIHVRDTRGEVLASLPGRLADARREFETCVDLAPPDSPIRARALLQLARVFTKMGNFDQARAKLDEALRIDQQQNVFSPSERNEIEQLTRGPAAPSMQQSVTLHR